MDVAYEWQSQQVGIPAHPGLLAGFADFSRKPAGAELLRLCGRGPTGHEAQPVRDAHVVPLCLTIRSLSRTTAASFAVHVDLGGQPVTCEGARTLGAVLQVGCGVRVLRLRRTRVGDTGAAALGASLSGSSLQELDLGECLVHDAGMRLFVRGLQVHGPPPALALLLLDGNPTGDASAVELVSLLEGPRRPPALERLGARPAPPRALSPEVDAALRVVCDLARVELLPAPRAAGVPTAAEEVFGGRGAASPGAAHLGGAAIAHAMPRSDPFSRPAASGAQHFAQLPELPGRSSSHLAAWMAGAERELREVKWLLGASAARLDGQHAKLMAEVEKVRGQLDIWVRSGDGGSTDGGGDAAQVGAADERRLEVLESRFDALERLVGREQSECAQMWQIVEAAAGAGAGSDRGAPGTSTSAMATPGAEGGHRAGSERSVRR